MRLLAISWAMPPMLTPRSLQVSRLLQHLARLDCPATVIAAETTAPIPGITADPALGTLYATSYSRRGVPYGDAPSRLRAMVGRGLDKDADWVERAVKTAQQVLAETPHTHLATFAQPWFDHLVGLGLRRHARLPWVAHFSDPWVDSPYYDDIAPPLRRRWEAEERAVVEASDALVFTTAETAELVMRKYAPTHRSKAFVVPHGFDPCLTPPAPPRDVGGKIRIVHTGDFYVGRRGPSGLFHALATLGQDPRWRERIELVLAGTVAETYLEEAAALGLGASVRCLGRLPLRETLETAAAADILVSIDAPAAESVFLPSKIIDYLAFAKPILGLTPARGSAAALLTELGCPAAPPDDPDRIVEALCGLLEKVARGEKPHERFRRVAERYEIGAVAARFRGVLAAAA
jgi:glycosyltransferase involved in cell wall biosynthesis